MTARAFGRTGLTVPRIGLGAGPLGDPALDEREAEILLLGALDLGVTLVDAARSQGLAEECIGYPFEKADAAIAAERRGYERCNAAHSPRPIW